RTADGRLGRFGRKAQLATLSEFNAGAFVNEMGITSPAEPNEQLVRGEAFPPGVDPTPDPELTQEALDATTAFVRLLAPPRPLPRGVVEQRGALVFLRIGCASCHFPVLVTGPNRVAALSLKIVRPYTDLLLHDMGPDLADICLGRAGGVPHRALDGDAFQNGVLARRPRCVDRAGDRGARRRSGRGTRPVPET